jgi:hypothetical protein
MPIEFKKNKKIGYKIRTKAVPSTKITCIKMLGLLKKCLYTMSYLSFTLLLSHYVLGSFSGVPTVLLFVCSFQL